MPIHVGDIAGWYATTNSQLAFVSPRYSHFGVTVTNRFPPLFKTVTQNSHPNQDTIYFSLMTSQPSKQSVISRGGSIMPCGEFLCSKTGYRGNWIINSKSYFHLDYN